MGALRISAFAFFMALVAAGSAQATPYVRTLAGTGAFGTGDGGATSATFMAPSGIATNGSGDFVVSDAAAQRIRVISRGGSVRTLAGGGIEKAPWGYAGGYADGPGSRARFNQPRGIAVDRKGNVYVADTGNHCVRRIDPAGVVSTYAGSRDAGNTNGPRLEARFERPEGIAVDRGGTIYVADPGSGLRRISPAGDVSTVNVDGTSAYVPIAVATYDGADGTVIFVGAQFGLFVLNSDGTRQRFPGAAATNFESTVPQSSIEPRLIQAHRLLGFPTALTALNDHTVAFADARTNTIRVLETVHRTLRVVGGQAIEDGSGDTGGFQDGLADASRFYSPLGISGDAHGNLFIADAGNRRIREISGINYRYAVAPTRGLLDAPLKGSADDYRIAYLGNSMVWYNTDWDDSIEGRIENRLNRDRAVASKTVRVTGVAGNEKVGASSEYAQWLGQVGAVDLVVLNLNIANVISTFGNDSAETLPRADVWGPELSSEVRALRAHLAASHIPLVVVTFPPPFNLDLAESAFTGVLSDINSYNANGVTVQQALNDAVRASGAPLIDLNSAFLDYERQNIRNELFGSDDYHFSKNGRLFVADAVSAALERLAPWSANR